MIDEGTNDDRAYHGEASEGGVNHGRVIHGGASERLTNDGGREMDGRELCSDK